MTHIKIHIINICCGLIQIPMPQIELYLVYLVVISYPL